MGVMPSLSSWSCTSARLAILATSAATRATISGEVLERAGPEPRAEDQLNDPIDSLLSLIERRARGNPEIAALTAQVRAALRQ